MSSDTLLAYLRNPNTIRAHCAQVYDLGLEGRLRYFDFFPDKIPEISDYVLRELQQNYPDGQVPYHSRMRHFEVGNRNRLAQLDATGNDRGEMLYELIFVSVLLDAGAGPDWSYRETDTGEVYSRSEGLAVASFHMFQRGLFHKPVLTVEDVAQGLQVSSSNPLVGLEGRVALLNSLKQSKSPSELFRELVKQGPTLKAADILKAILEGYNHIWPSGFRMSGISVGDVGPYSRIQSPIAPGVIPFHKLSQWLTYSLIEPLEELGIRVLGLDELTGLPEYRNGGLFVDRGALKLKDPKAATQRHHPQTEFIVEWRAMTVMLLDQVAKAIRFKLGKTSEELPLACVLQGGTWSAGRKAAKAMRPEGGPPLQIQSDGTIF